MPPRSQKHVAPPADDILLDAHRYGPAAGNHHPTLNHWSTKCSEWLMHSWYASSEEGP
jgi:hypothetical protein